jgi:phage head maturation protease
MSDTIEIETPQTAQRGLVLEVIDAGWKMRSDGRSVRGRIVPFNEPTMIIDRGERFREQFLPGCLTRLCQIVNKRGNAGWISLNLDHDESWDGRIGYAAMIEQVDNDGGWADFRLYNGPQLDKARSMLEESHSGLSVMFDDIAAPRLLNGIRSRVQIAIAHVAATAFPAYRGAAIASMRDSAASSDAPTIDEIDDRPALREWQEYLASIAKP